MSRVNNKSLIASAIVGALAIASSNFAVATNLNELQQNEATIFIAAAKSQAKINNLYEQTQELLGQYRYTVDTADVLRGYNDHVQRMVDDQKASITSLQDQIDSVDKIKQGVVPLMYKMIDTLGKFVELDVPMNLERRQERVEGLREIMDNADVTTSEKFRLVLEAYEIEASYGTIFDVYQGEIDLGSQKLTADFVHMGRVALMAQSLDKKHSWVWNNGTRAWEELDEEYSKPITDSIAMARKQLPLDLSKLPIFAAGAK